MTKIKSRLKVKEERQLEVWPLRYVVESCSPCGRTTLPLRILQIGVPPWGRTTLQQLKNKCGEGFPNMVEQHRMKEVTAPGGRTTLVGYVAGKCPGAYSGLRFVDSGPRLNPQGVTAMGV